MMRRVTLRSISWRARNRNACHLRGLQSFTSPQGTPSACLVLRRRPEPCMKVRNIGCAASIGLSVVLSILLTVVLNLLLRTCRAA